ncbi:MAG: UDP-N-acetylmuramate--L-alanine ligase [Alphaproteobacteria bacterium]|nr:UDP-N-acetylmuramate--L-alanine ligase [Alphaproteobacteria bacterium]
MQLPDEIGPIHFVGIGGIGMSGIAEVLCHLGYSVSGSDMAANANVARLEAAGARVFIGHRAENIAGAGAIVVSSAIKPSNPELEAARAARLPVFHRADMLAELMRGKRCVAITGTHGKTTTTTLVATLLDQGGLDPTVINGGIINAYGSNARIGKGDWMVVEADESDGSFVKLPAEIAIVTNIDPEHLDHFGTFEAVREAFRTVVTQLPEGGLAVMCSDHPVVGEMAGELAGPGILTYGENAPARMRLCNLKTRSGASSFDVVLEDGKAISGLTLPMPGRHNALNATAAIAVAHRLGVGEATIRAALAGFGGVKRRFTRTGECNGVTIIDDYGHHPVEIAAVLKAAREAGEGKVIAVVQPHRFSRLKALFEGFCSCFDDADTVIVADVYAAGEAPIAGIDRDHFIAGLSAHGHGAVMALPGPSALAGMVRDIARPGDLVICLGAGNITQWAYALPDQLKALGPKT